MANKQVCQLNADGYFIGMADADESPLEPGVFLIPGGCIDVSPPEAKENTVAKWTNEWVYENVPVYEEPVATEEEIKLLRITELKTMLSSTDFKVLPDYDQPNEEIKAQRQLWRDEIRSLEANLV